MIKAVIFDSDGMLSHGPRFSDTYAKERNIPIEDMIPFFKGPFNDCIVGKTDLKEELENGGWLQKWGWIDSVEEFLEYWFSVGDQLDANVFATVTELREKGTIVVLATNQEKYRTAYLSEKFGYENAFDKIFSSARTGHKKPNADFFQKILEYLQEQDPSITKENVLFWDDDMENVDGAHAFGIKSEQFTNEQSYREKMAEYSLLRSSISAL